MHNFTNTNHTPVTPFSIHISHHTLYNTLRMHSPPPTPPFPHTISFHYSILPHTHYTMKRMFSKKGLVESSKEDTTQDIDSDADLQE